MLGAGKEASVCLQLLPGPNYLGVSQFTALVGVSLSKKIIIEISILYFKITPLLQGCSACHVQQLLAETIDLLHPCEECQAAMTRNSCTAVDFG